MAPSRPDGTHVSWIFMNSKELNTKKSELLDQQTAVLNAAYESHSKLTTAQEESFAAATAEIQSIDMTLDRMAAIAKSKAEVGAPTSDVFVAQDSTKPKFFAMGGYRKATTMDVDEDYTKKFWHSLRTKADHERFMIQNASLGEGGTSTAGGALVPIETDPTIPALAIEETVCRELSRVISTDRNINLPYQSALTVAALKAESNSSGTNAFATNAPGFATTELQAYVIGDSVYASWELLEDSKAAAQFIPMDIQRSIRVKEENLFVNGTGSGQPQGYLGNGTTATGVDAGSGSAALSVNALLDTVATLNRAYYAKAKWLVARPEFNRLLKKQIASSQYQTFVTFDPNGDARLFGYPVAFSAEMPGYAAGSPPTTGAWMFGSFSDFAVIGDRGDSNIRIKVLDQIAALNGQTVILGYRRTDQRILLAQAVVQFNTTS
jgi:HK97 family phage major capsid protein